MIYAPVVVRVGCRSFGSYDIQVLLICRLISSKNAVSEMTCHASNETLNCVHSMTLCKSCRRIPILLLLHRTFCHCPFRYLTYKHLCLVSTMPLPFCRRRRANQRSAYGLFIPMYTEWRFQRFRSHAQRQRQNGNGMVETRHYSVPH